MVRGRAGAGGGLRLEPPADGNYLNVLPWWGLWLGAAHSYARGGRRGWLGVGGAAIMLMILAGAHQLAAYFLLLSDVYAVVQIALDRGGGGVGW